MSSNNNKNSNNDPNKTNSIGEKEQGDKQQATQSLFGQNSSLGSKPTFGAFGNAATNTSFGFGLGSNTTENTNKSTTGFGSFGNQQNSSTANKDNTSPFSGAFGASNANSAPKFGLTSSNNSEPNKEGSEGTSLPKSSGFGGFASKDKPSSTFGVATSTNQNNSAAAGSNKSAFDSFSTSTQKAFAFGSQGNKLGSSTDTAASASGPKPSLFGTTTTAFGTSSNSISQNPTTNLFGNKSSTSGFGQPTEQTGSDPKQNSETTGSTSFFGSQQKPTESITQTSSTAPKTGLFGAGNSNISGGFGSNSSSQNASGGNLFGQKAGATSTIGFGSSKPDTPSAAGGFTLGNRETTQNTRTILGSEALNSPGWNNNIFGAKSTSQTSGASSGGILNVPGTTTASAPSGGLFGSSTPAATPAPSGGLFGTSTAATASSNLFGGSAAKVTAPAPSGGGLFGTSTSATTSTPSGGLFGASTSATTSSNLFGGSTAKSTTPTPSGSELFGASTAATTSAPSTGLFGASNVATTSANLFGGNLAQTTPATTSLFGNASTTSGSLTLPPEAGGLTSQVSVASTAPGFNGMTSQPIASTTSGSSNLFGTSANTTTAAPATSLFGSSAATATTNALTNAPAEATSTSGATQAAENLSGLSDEYLNMTLEDFVNESFKDAIKVKELYSSLHNNLLEWDFDVTTNGGRLARLNSALEETKKDQNSVNDLLDFVDLHQSQLDKTLTEYEKAVEQSLIASNENQHHSPLDSEHAKFDQERERIYLCAEDLNDQMNLMSEQLDELNSSAVEAVNRDFVASAGDLGPKLEKVTENLQEVDILLKQLKSNLNILGSLNSVSLDASKVGRLF